VKAITILLAASTVMIAGQSEAVKRENPQPTAMQIPLRGEPWQDAPVRSAGREVLRAETVWYGRYQIIGEEYYALSITDKADVMWTFDRGEGPVDPPPPLLSQGGGWSVQDRTEDLDTYFRVVDSNLDLGLGVPAPIISGARSLWIGLDRPGADNLC
jgi:hypothetical protein